MLSSTFFYQQNFHLFKWFALSDQKSFRLCLLCYCHGKIRMIRLILRTKNNLTSTKRKTEMSTFVLHTRLIFLHLSTGWSIGFYIKNLSWLRVKISYHKLNNLAKLLNGDLSIKIGWGVLSRYLMDRECNCSLPSKVNGKCVYEGKFQTKCLIYKENSWCVTIFI